MVSSDACVRPGTPRRCFKLQCGLTLIHIHSTHSKIPVLSHTQQNERLGWVTGRAEAS